MQGTEGVGGQTGRARWSGLAALGLLLAGLGPLLMLVASLVWGLEGGEAPFFVITAAVALVAAILVWRFGTWSKIVGIIAALLVAGALFWTAFGLGSPTSFFDFVPGLLVIPGALVAIVASVAAILAKRRGHVTPVAVGGEQTAIRIVLGVVVILALLSGVLTVAARSTADEAGAARTVVMKDFEFDRRDYQFEPGSTVLVRNSDPFLHTFTVDALGIDEALTPGSEVLVRIPANPGTYVIYCRPHTGEPEDPAEDDMAARLRVG